MAINEIYDVLQAIDATSPETSEKRKSIFGKSRSTSSLYLEIAAGLPDANKSFALILKNKGSLKDGSYLDLVASSEEQCDSFVKCFRKIVIQERDRQRVLRMG